MRCARPRFCFKTRNFVNLCEKGKLSGREKVCWCGVCWSSDSCAHACSLDLRPKTGGVPWREEKGTQLFSKNHEPGRPGGCPPGLPQIRTCPIKAYGSSGHVTTGRQTE